MMSGFCPSPSPLFFLHHFLTLPLYDALRAEGKSLFHPPLLPTPLLLYAAVALNLHILQRPVKVWAAWFTVLLRLQNLRIRCNEVVSLAGLPIGSRCTGLGHTLISVLGLHLSLPAWMTGTATRGEGCTDGSTIYRQLRRV